jgi:hypothetical protein
MFAQTERRNCAEQTYRQYCRSLFDNRRRVCFISARDYADKHDKNCAKSHIDKTRVDCSFRFVSQFVQHDRTSRSTRIDLRFLRRSKSKPAVDPSLFIKTGPRGRTLSRSRKPKTVGQMAKELGLSSPTILTHVRALMESELLRE